MALFLFFLCYMVIFLILFLCFCRFSPSYEAVKEPASYYLRLSDSAKEQLLNSYFEEYHLKYDTFQNVITSHSGSYKIKLPSKQCSTKLPIFEVPFVCESGTWKLQIAHGQYGVFYGYNMLLLQGDSYSPSKKNPLCTITVRQYKNDYLFSEQTTKQHGLSIYMLMDSLSDATYQTELCLEFKQAKVREAFLKGLRQNGIPQKQYEVYHNKIYLYFSDCMTHPDSEFSTTKEDLERTTTISRYHVLTKFLSSETDKLLYLCQYEPDFLHYIIEPICDDVLHEGR